MTRVRHFKPSACRLFAGLLGAAFFLAAPAQAASVALATSPLATSTTTSVKPNLLFLLDNSGSMDWDHMPDDSSDGGSSVVFSYGHYGTRSSQCNQVYYDPTITYTPPVQADGATLYNNASFSGAWVNGFNTGSGTTDLRTNFKASLSLNADASGQTAYYYNYSGTQTSAVQKNYHSTTNTFVSECGSAQNSDTGEAVFTKIVVTDADASTTAKLTLNCSSCTSTSVSSIKVDGVELMSGASTGSATTSTAATNIATKITLNGFSATASSNVVTITGVPASAKSIVVTKTSGNMSFSPTIYQQADAAKKTNFANWYSYYRTRLQMMKTAAGHAFKTLNNNYRVGLMKISASTAPVVEVGTFEGSLDTEQRGKWYKSLYDMTASGSTPLRTALSNAGRYYAGKLTGVTDPLQYSCQQNFTIMSTDGYWNSGDPVDINGSAFSATDNQDATASRPMYDGAQANTTITITYTRDSYSCGGCGSTTNQLRRQPQIGSCSVTVSGTPTGSESCTPGSWSNDGARIDGACVSNSACTSSIPAPNPSTKVESGRVTTPGSTGGALTRNSLADIAMYYYQTDLRTSDLGNCTGAGGEDVCANNVFTSSSDNNIKQHMTTFTLGMGASGRMIYASCYLSDSCANNQDFQAVKLGSTANSSASPPICSWQADGTVCNWPVPGMSGSDGLISNIDDLWHAAVNGRGAYFAATNPTSLSAGLSNALSGLNARRGSAAAAATSTLNPVAGNNYAYVASYTTVTWKGNLEARGINTDTGVVSENASWCVENVAAGTCPSPGSIQSETDGDVTVFYCATPDSVICTDGFLDGTVCKVQMATACTGTMASQVSDTSDSRNIYTASSGALTAFNATYATANPAPFASATISALSQWSSLTAAQRTAAAGANLLNYLRGQYGYEDRTANLADNRLFRYREAVMGDALESQPAFIGAPVFSYPYKGYDTFLAAQASRAGTVYMGANDGMLHAFNGDTGAERWAYIPSMVVPNLWKLADKNYATMHTNYVNGSPITSDICVSSCDTDSAVWKTILVAGLNGGGRGYYALDITNPAAPVFLWELTPTSGTFGTGTVKDDDVGYGFGHPVITRRADGTWVVLVTSGYNNTGPGTGKGFLYVLNAATGAIVSKISTGAGDTTTPSGLAHITGWNNDPSGNQVGYAYGGDLLGNVWRFDINSTAAAAVGTGGVMKFAELKDNTGTAQPVTTAPLLGTSSNKRIIYVATGKYLELGDLTTTQLQTLYAIKDDDATSTLVNPRASLSPRNLVSSADTPTRTVNNGDVPSDFNFYNYPGWYVDFPDSGERVNIDGKLVQGVLLVATTVPSNTACSPGGYGWLNFFDYETGGAINTTTALVSTKYDAPIVGINVFYISGKPIVGVVTSSNPTPKLETNVEFKASAPTFTGKRVTWRELVQ